MAKGLCRRCYHQKRWQNNIKASRRQARLRAKRARKANPEKFRLRNKRWAARRPEYGTIHNHYNIIIHRSASAYKDLMYFDGRNPQKGGSFKAGEQWLITHLGPRPSKNYELHIVDRRLGFVPDNLAWVPKEKHIQEELINRLLLENQQLRAENNRLRAAQ